MLYKDDPMLAELRQIKAKLWERSEHDLHKMAQIMVQETREVINKYKKSPQVESTKAPL
jgi:23S rRNA maturation-related 3'-5' exoribonuclease YhaM